MSAQRLPTAIPWRNAAIAYLAIQIPQVVLRMMIWADPSVPASLAAIVPDRLSRTVMLLVAQYATFLLVVALAVPRRAMRDLFRLRISWSMVGEVFAGYIGFLLASAAYVRLMHRFLPYAPGFEQQMDYTQLFGEDFLAYAVFGITALVVAPIVEELFFRGVLVGGLRSKLGTVGAIFLGALLFAVEHQQPTNILPLFLIGLINGTLYLRHRTLVAPILFHMVNNALAFTLLIVRS